MLKIRVMEQLAGLVQIARPINGCYAVIYTLLGAYLCSDTAHLLSPPVIRAALVVALIVAFGFVVNDYCDVAVDSISKPSRPIPSGRVSRPTARALAITLAVTSLLVAYALGPWLAAVALVTLIFSAGYSYRLKNTLLLGNGTMAILEASIVLYGGLVVGNLTPSVWVVSVLILLYVFAHEILYNIEDHEGDAEAGLNTTATRLGVTAALLLFQLVAFMFVVAAVIPWFLHLASIRYLYAVVACTVLPLVGVVGRLRMNPTKSRVIVSARVMKFIWLSSLLPMVLLK